MTKSNMSSIDRPKNTNVTLFYDACDELVNVSKDEIALQTIEHLTVEIIFDNLHEEERRIRGWKALADLYDGLDNARLIDTFLNLMCITQMIKFVKSFEKTKAIINDNVSTWSLFFNLVLKCKFDDVDWCVAMATAVCDVVMFVFYARNEDVEFAPVVWDHLMTVCKDKELMIKEVVTYVSVVCKFASIKETLAFLTPYLGQDTKQDTEDDGNNKRQKQE